MMRNCLRLLLGAWLVAGMIAEGVEPLPQLPGTEAFADGTDISADPLASQLVDGVDRFLLGEIDAAREERQRAWLADHATPEQAQATDAARRERLAHILGLRDPRPPFESPQLLATPERSAVMGRGGAYEILAVRWPAVQGVYGEGLLLVPSGEAVASVVVIPDAEVTPEQYVGLSPGVPMQGQLPRLLAERGCRVLVPVLIDRHREGWLRSSPACERLPLLLQRRS